MTVTQNNLKSLDKDLINNENYNEILENQIKPIFINSVNNSNLVTKKTILNDTLNKSKNSKSV